MLWTENEQARLIGMWPQHKLPEIAAALGRSYSSVRSAIDRYQLRRTKLNSWRKEEIDSVVALWPLYSADQIAKRLGGRTRNAIIGVINRQRRAGVKLQLKPKRLSAPRPPPTTRSATKPRPMPRTNHTIQCPCQLVELDDINCKWPFGDPREPGFYFCGAARQPDRPYCPEHCRKSYQQEAYRREGSRTFIAKPVFVPTADTRT